MKRKVRIVLTSLIAIGLSTSCIAGISTENIYGCIRAEADAICTQCTSQSDSNSISSQLIVLNTDNLKEIVSTVNYIPGLVRKNDDQYISNIEKRREGQYKFVIDAFYNRNSSTINFLKSTWGIEDDDYFVVVGRNQNQNPEEIVQGDLLTYFVGVNTGNIIIIPEQGGKEAYSIKDNQIIKVYSDLSQSSSYKWRS